MTHARTRFLALFLATLLCAASVYRAEAAPAPGAPPQIRVLSNRADLVSGGDALVEIVVPAGAGAPTVDANGRNVTSAFRRLGNGRVLGLVTGLRVGSNTLTARAGGRAARLTVQNAPIGGPVFSGPQIEPWTCQAGAVDAKCNQATTYQLLYLPRAGVQLQAYDPANPPPVGSIAQTTTQTGTTVPFIVREETGYIARDQYRIAVLFQPGKPWSAAAPQPQFNHKLVITHGASCDTSYEAGSAPDVRNRTALGAGFAVMSHALNNAGHNCNIVTQAEAMVMTKERVIDRYGELRYTIGSGCSGGSLVQQQVANAYPGLYQGISPQCSFTDAWSSAMQYVDYVGLLRYFQDPTRWEPGTVWDPVAITEVLDHPNPANPVTFTSVIANSGDPSRPCPGVPDEDVYDPASNPDGVKCTLQDYMVNVFGAAPTGSPTGPSATPASSTGSRGCRAG